MYACGQNIEEHEREREREREKSERATERERDLHDETLLIFHGAGECLTSTCVRVGVCVRVGG